MSKPPNVLFLCTGNSCRSQMAEGWLRHLHGSALVVQSAGIEAHGMNPRAMQVMAEANVPIDAQSSQQLTQTMLDDADLVITVCDNAQESCPLLPPHVQTVHVPFPDPPALARNASTDEEALDAYRQVRDAIRDFVSRTDFVQLITSNDTDQRPV